MLFQMNTLAALEIIKRTSLGKGAEDGNLGRILMPDAKGNVAERRSHLLE